MFPVCFCASHRKILLSPTWSSAWLLVTFYSSQVCQLCVYASGSFMMYLFCLINRHLQRIFWTIFHTLKAKNTFCAILSFSRIICNINFHWTHFFTFTTRNTFTFITFDSEQRKITHRFQKYCDRTYVFAKCTIILKGKSQYYPNCIVYDISNDNT